LEGELVGDRGEHQVGMLDVGRYQTLPGGFDSRVDRLDGAMGGREV